MTMPGPRPWSPAQHVNAALRQLTKASIKLRPDSGQKPDDYYAVNRVWAEVDALHRRLIGTARAGDGGRG